MANAVTRVVHRCEEAAESLRLDLSECQLMQVPDAVYHLMRHTELKGCNLSGNVITKIPPKFAVKFSLITDLNLSNNTMSKLPDELADLAALERLDISHNAFIALPHAVYKMPKLSKLNASHNHIVEIEVDRLEQTESLEDVDLQENPLTMPNRNALQLVTRPRVVLSVTAADASEEDWDDLNV
ncbi:unnamed protein product [Bemisia tabaci]|uniref:Leucine-rich repeat-containing protein 20 n=1 Tax=Bemisia tabaci TaxID=7038 RepID=A0A9P0A4U7_BEMTA|nr:PREDICTED: leucine-rich repeat protein soc-2 isoform X2 [Bemisia tabaci]CAH0384256.1 unnamed protein product [Bemisia tabaci]